MFGFLLFLTLLVCFQTQKTDQFNYEAAFSDQSEVTMVITSCGRMDFLRKTIHTFFATNDYPLYGIILIDDCQTNFSDLKSCFPPPTRHQDFENSIKIIVNEKNLKLTKSIDRAYAQVETRYLLHFEDDWQTINFKGKVRKALQVLQFTETKQIKVSQVTFGRKLAHHSFRSQILWTNKNTSFFYLSHYVDNPYHFSFNPFLMDYKKIYKSVFAGNLYETITKPICEAQSFQKDKIMCSEYYPGLYLKNRGYRPVILDNDDDMPEIEHIGKGHHVNTILRQKGKLSKIKLVLMFIFFVQLARTMKEVNRLKGVEKKGRQVNEEQI